MDIVKIVNQVPDGFEGTNGLQLLDSDGTLEGWEEKKRILQADWLKYLGEAPYGKFTSQIREEDWETRLDYNGRLVYVQTEPDYYEKTYLLVPKKLKKKNPAMLVFYYDIDTMVGEDKGGAHFTNTPTRFFALELVKRGYVVMVMRWFYQGLTKGNSLQDYYVGVERMQKVYPGFKGLSKVVSDASFTLDYLTNLPFVDKNRIGVMGHSLGGKMGLYAAAFDTRIKAAIISELGIGLSFSNWDAPWYLGPEVRDTNFNLDHHQLLGLIAPRPLLVIAGDSADNDSSWHYINSAKEVYNLYGKKDDIGLYNHRTGHQPNEKSMTIAYNWLDHYFK